MDLEGEVSKGAKFCKDTCPWCRRARTKGGIARWSVKNLESRYCPMCRAYEREYGRPAYE